jgi:hypothetical protein
MAARYFTDDDRPIKVEIGGTTVASQGQLQDASRDRVQEKIKELSDAALFEAFHAIYKVARKTEMLISDLQQSDSPQGLSGAEVEFGVMFNSSLEAIITSGVEATITIKLTWGGK